MRLGIISMLLTSLVAVADSPRPVALPLESALLVSGFDDNDRVQITVTGRFLESCWKISSATATRAENESVIRVEMKGHRESAKCLPMLVPFVETLNVGLLEEDDYAVIDETSGKVLGVLPVKKRAGMGPDGGSDDFLYAPVSDAYVLRDPMTTQWELVMVGEFQDKCSKMKEVKVEYQDKAIVVRPIFARDPQGKPCEVAPEGFTVRKTLKPVKGARLLHVRALSGQAINKVVNLF